MLHRIVAMFIVGFWLAMTGLLVIRELYPLATDLNSIPTGHVGRLMFQHEQASDLDIYDRDIAVGYARLDPTWTKSHRYRLLKTHGSTALSLPGVTQRLSWIGSIEFDDTFNVRLLEMDISSGEPSSDDPPHQMHIEYDAATNLTKYALRASGKEYARNAFTLDQAGVADLLGQIGFGPDFLEQFNARRSETPPPEFTAMQSSVNLNGESISTFLVSMKVGGQTLWEAHISQLGQVLKARAPIFGYKLVPSGVKP